MRVAIVCVAVLSALNAVAQTQTPAVPPNSIVVEGSVSRPGVYPVQTPAELNTVTTVIAQAGGLIRYASHKAVIVRMDDQGQTIRVEVPLWDIINRRKPDIVLRPGDILQVPDTPRRLIAL
jgi:protein involved in polysaccharide export with SLBB domain